MEPKTFAFAPSKTYAKGQNLGLGARVSIPEGRRNVDGRRIWGVSKKITKMATRTPFAGHPGVDSEENGMDASPAKVDG